MNNFVFTLFQIRWFRWFLVYGVKFPNIKIQSQLISRKIRVSGNLLNFNTVIEICIHVCDVDPQGSLYQKKVLLILFLKNIKKGENFIWKSTCTEVFFSLNQSFLEKKKKFVKLIWTKLNNLFSLDKWQKDSWNLHDW